MNRNICLLIGNGFTKDFVGENFNTSKPLNEFNSNAISYKWLFSRIEPIVEEIKHLSSQLDDDFKAMEIFIEHYGFQSAEECQLRRFLAISYSKLQLEIDKIQKPNWRWLNWIGENKKNITMSISFNYDLLFERTLDANGIRYFRTGSTEKHLGIPILKPHGSIDFDLSSVQIGTKTSVSFLTANEITDRQQLWGIYTHSNQANGTVDITQKKLWMLPRFQPDIIPPSQANYHRRLEWVDKGFRQYAMMASNFTDLVMIGHSYSDCDREEVNYFLEKLNPNATIHIVNPSYNEHLINKLENLGLEYKIIMDYVLLPK